MNANEELKRRETEFYGMLQEMLDNLNLPSDRSDRSMKLANSMMTYCQALQEASAVSPQEVAEHYDQMTKHIPLQAGFFATVIDDYRKRHAL